MQNNVSKSLLNVVPAKNKLFKSFMIDLQFFSALSSNFSAPVLRLIYHTWRWNTRVTNIPCKVKNISLFLFTVFVHTFTICATSSCLRITMKTQVLVLCDWKSYYFSVYYSVFCRDSCILLYSITVCLNRQVYPMTQITMTNLYSLLVTILSTFMSPEAFINADFIFTFRSLRRMLNTVKFSHKEIQQRHTTQGWFHIDSQCCRL